MFQDEGSIPSVSTKRKYPMEFDSSKYRFHRKTPEIWICSSHNRVGNLEQWMCSDNDHTSWYSLEGIPESLEISLKLYSLLKGFLLKEKLDNA